MHRGKTAILIDHLVGAAEQRGGDIDAECSFDHLDRPSHQDRRNTRKQGPARRVHAANRSFAMPRIDAYGASAPVQYVEATTVGAAISQRRPSVGPIAIAGWQAHS
jgi:hypothetical protein